VDGLEQIAGGEGLTPGTFRRENDQIDVGGRDAPMHIKIGGKISRPLLKQI
jgi:hypothetical protein